MANYKYKQGGANYGILVQYNIVPDIGTALEVGQEVMISGNVRSYNDALNNVEIAFRNTNESYGVGYFNFISLGINVPKNSNRDFVLRYVVENEYTNVIHDGMITPNESPFFPSFTDTSEKLYISFLDSSAENAYTNIVESQYIMYKNPDNAPKINNFDVGRAKLRDGEYIISDDGTELLVKFANGSGNSANAAMFIQLLNNYGEYEFHKQCMDEITIGKILSSEGYNEKTPYLFDDFNIDVSDSIELLFVIINEEGHTSAKVSINKSFANLHLSGRKNGGVSIGGFSSSTDDEPKFESYYKAYLYKGFDEKTIKILGNVIYPVGSIYICTNDADPNIIFGGWWEPIEGRFLVASGGDYDSGSTGGSATHSFSASHRHLSPAGFSSGILGVVNINDTQSTGSGRPYASINATHTGNLTSNISLGYTASATVSANVSTIPPYIAVDVWKRMGLYDPEIDW